MSYNLRFDPEQFPEIAEKFDEVYNSFVAPLEHHLFTQGKVFNVGLIDARAMIYGAYSDDMATLNNIAQFGQPQASESPYNAINMNVMFLELVKNANSIQSLIHGARKLEEWIDKAMNDADNREDYWNMVKYGHFGKE